MVTPRRVATREAIATETMPNRARLNASFTSCIPIELATIAAQVMRCKYGTSSVRLPPAARRPPRYIHHRSVYEDENAVDVIRRDRRGIGHLGRVGSEGADGKGTARLAPRARPQRRAHQGLRQRDESALGVSASRRAHEGDGRALPG